MRCGLCLSTCPVYSIDREESSSPRGRLHLVDRISDRVVLKRFINNCLLCGSCIDVCPNGVDVPSILRGVRNEEEIIREVYGIARMVQGKKFSLLDLISKIINIDNNIGGFIKIFAKGRFIPEISSEKIEYNNAVETKTIAIFTGCISRLFYPSTINKIARFYRGLGYNVYIPETQVCCGLMNYSAGDTDKAIKLAKMNIEVFSSDKIGKIITPCASCSHMLENYAKIVKGGEIVSKKVVSFDRDILNNIKRRLEESENQSVIHIPCHIRNSSDKTLYKEIKGFNKYKNVRIIDSCCGYGGVFNLYEYEKSIRIGERIAQEIGDAKILYTFCSGCYLQIYDVLKRFKKDIIINNLAELL